MELLILTSVVFISYTKQYTQKLMLLLMQSSFDTQKHILKHPSPYKQPRKMQHLCNQNGMSVLIGLLLGGGESGHTHLMGIVPTFKHWSTSLFGGLLSDNSP